MAGILVKRLFLAAMVLTAVGGLPMSASAAEPPDSETKVLLAKRSVAEIDLLVQQVHQGINQYRAERNLPPLVLNPYISQQAQNHSLNMAQSAAKFSHQGFKERVGALQNRVVYRRAAENLAYNQGYQDPVGKAISGWIESKGHHKNMIGDFNLTGIGVAKNKQGEYYFTQIFIKEN